MMPRVLIVEDEAAIRAMTALALEQAGLEVDEADNATLAWDKINDRLPNLILLDGMLPVSADWSLSGACVEGRTANARIRRLRRSLTPGRHDKLKPTVAVLTTALRTGSSEALQSGLGEQQGWLWCRCRSAL